MPLEQNEINEVANLLATRLFVQPNATATLNVTQLRSIVTAVNAAFTATGQQIHALYPGVVFETALVSHVQASVASATGQHVAMAVALWAMKRGGLI